MLRHLSVALRMILITIVITGVIYPLAVTGVAQIIFPYRANGSRVSNGSSVSGSELIGQQFTETGYFHSRPSAAGQGYDAQTSGGSNLGPTNKILIDTVKERVSRAIKDNPGLTRGNVPADMVTASASGLDPDISIANAYAQAGRVAKARRLSKAAIVKMIDANTTNRQFYILGEPRVNVLALNRALDAEVSGK
jgi:potassium-transporting ATPase KdpC subunit